MLSKSQSSQFGNELSANATLLNTLRKTRLKQVGWCGFTRMNGDSSSLYCSACLAMIYAEDLTQFLVSPQYKDELALVKSFCSFIYSKHLRHCLRKYFCRTDCTFCSHEILDYLCNLRKKTSSLKSQFVLDASDVQLSTSIALIESTRDQSQASRPVEINKLRLLSDVRRLILQSRELRNTRATSVCFTSVNDSRHARLIYFVANGSAHDPDLASVRRKLREVKYTRNLQDLHVAEAQRQCSAYSRWVTFSSSTSKWQRSVGLAFHLAQLGFYYDPDLKQNRTDRIKCAFCYIAKSNWWSFAYPETESSYRSRVSDLEVAAQMDLWHRRKSPMCPRVFGLAVDAIEFTAAELAEARETIRTSPITRPNRGVEAGEYEVGVIYCSTPSEMLSVRVGLQQSSGRITEDEEEEDAAQLLAEHEVEPLAVWTSESTWNEDAKAGYAFKCNALVDAVRWIGSELEPGKLSFARFVHEARRVESFELGPYTVELLEESGVEAGSSRWPSSGKPDAKTLASAGFFATFNGDQVRCFCCGLSLSDWDENSDPWVRHAVQKPDCGYLRMSKGSRFVQEASESGVSAHHDPVVGYIPNVTYVVDPRDVRARPALPLMRAVAEDLLLDRHLLKLAIATVMKQRCVVELMELLETVRSLKSMMRQLGVSDSARFVKQYDSHLAAAEERKAAAERERIESVLAAARSTSSDRNSNPDARPDTESTTVAVLGFFPECPCKYK